MKLVHEFGDRLVLHNEGKTLFGYRYGTKMPPDHVPKPYCHPLATPSGRVVTLDAPHDHLWQRGLFMAFSRIDVDGEAFNFWGGPWLQDGHWTFDGVKHGSIEHDDFTSIDLTDDSARISELVMWRTPGLGAILQEDRELVVHAPVNDSYWMLDWTSTWSSLVDALVIRKTGEDKWTYGYGGLTWRGIRDFVDGVLTSSDNPEPGASSVIDKPGVWADCSGGVDGEGGGRAGIAILDHPMNRGYPSAWFGFDSTHAGEYCYFCAAVLRSAGDIELSRNDDFTLRYRVVVHDGSAESVPLDDLQTTFAGG